VGSNITDRVSVIIVTHNSEPVLPDCLRALRVAMAGGNHQLVVVDNDSDDRTVETVRRHFPQSLILPQKKNLGFARACNLGGAAASGKYLLFLNPDMIVDSDVLTALRMAIDAEPRAGLVSGRMRFPDGAFQPSCRRLPTLRNLLFSRGSFLSRVAPPTAGEIYTLGDYTVVTEVPAVAGTMLMVRADRFRELGGFDERYFMYMEDTDLSRRMTRAGYVNLYVPSAGGVHSWGRSSSVGRFRRKCYHHRSVWQYFRKYHHPLLTWLVLPWLLAVNLLLVALLPGRGSDG